MRPMRGRGRPRPGRRPRPIRYPLATVMMYGPDDRTVTKLAVGIVRGPDDPATAVERWRGADVMADGRVATEIIEFLSRHGVRTVMRAPVILGCPHEEGTDFPEGEDCPLCPFWAGKQGSGGDDTQRWAALRHVEVTSFDPGHPPRRLW